MSSLLALQTKDTIVFASDTALSATVKDKTYRVGNNETKIFEYQDFIMFASGKKYLRDAFISMLNNSPTISEIQEVLDNHIIQHSEEYSLEIVIAMKDLSKLIFLSSVDGFTYKESLPNDYTNMFTAGCKTIEVANKFEEYYQQSPLLQSLQSTYKDLSCNEIGGYLDVIILEKDSLRRLQFNVDDMKVYSDGELFKLYDLVFANKLHGKIILSNKLWVEDVLGVVEVKSGLVKIYDQYGIPRVYLGRYPSYDNPNDYLYGLRVDNGQFSMRTSTSDKRGIQIDGKGVRGYNSNGVETFNLDTSGHVKIVGSLDIRSSPDALKGTVIDDSGITIYGNSGQIMFRADHSGNIYFRGRLDGATGTVSNLGGTINNMGGSFVGSINSDGTFRGLTTGTLSAQTVDTIRLKAEQITTGKLSANVIDTQSLSAATIEVDQLRANGIQVNDLSAISSNLGNITGGNIDITESISIGDGIYLKGGMTGIYFPTWSQIFDSGGSLTVEAFNILHLVGGAGRIEMWGDVHIHGALTGG